MTNVNNAVSKFPEFAGLGIVDLNKVGALLFSCLLSGLDCGAAARRSWHGKALPLPIASTWEATI